MEIKMTSYNCCYENPEWLLCIAFMWIILFFSEYSMHGSIFWAQSQDVIKMTTFTEQILRINMNMLKILGISFMKSFIHTAQNLKKICCGAEYYFRCMLSCKKLTCRFGAHRLIGKLQIVFWAKSWQISAIPA